MARGGSAVKDGEAAAELSSICLQPERDTPDWGTRYAFMEDPEDGLRIESALSLVGHTVDGRMVSLPAAENLSIAAERGQSAVKLSVPRAVLNSFGLTSLTVRLIRPIALAPQTTDGEPMQTVAELARARGPLRRVAEQVLTSADEHVAAVRVVRNVINALPSGRRANAAEFTTAWQNAFAMRAAGNPAEISAGALGLAGTAYGNCLDTGSTATAFDDYRTCLGVMHDRLIDKIGDAYWHALKLGS